MDEAGVGVIVEVGVVLVAERDVVHLVREVVLRDVFVVVVVAELHEHFAAAHVDARRRDVVANGGLWTWEEARKRTVLLSRTDSVNTEKQSLSFMFL